MDRSVNYQFNKNKTEKSDFIEPTISKICKTTTKPSFLISCIAKCNIIHINAIY